MDLNRARTPGATVVELCGSGRSTSAAELIILTLDHTLAAMAYTDYDADATELLETYGESSHECCCMSRTDYKRADFLMKFIIIGV